MIRFFVLTALIISQLESKGQIFLSNKDYSNYLKIAQSTLKSTPEATLIDIYKYFFQKPIWPRTSYK